MSSKKDNNNLWSMNYSYKLTPESQYYFYDWTQPTTADKRHQVEKEMQLLRDIDLWVDIMGDDLPEAKAIIEKIRNK